MPVLTFHCTFGVLGYDQLLSLLVWMFEIPPSKININYNKVEVPVTPITKAVYSSCLKNGEYRCSAPRVISTRFGIILRKFNVTSPEFRPDPTGYNMLCAMSGGHHIEGEWDTDSKKWEMSSGLGYRNTGIRFPISATEKFRNPGNRTGIGFIGSSLRKEWEPIQFVKKRPEINEDFLHTLWITAHS